MATDIPRVAAPRIPAREARGRDDIRPAFLDSRPGGPASRIAAAFPTRSPVTIFVAVLLAGLAAATGATIALGLLIVDVLVPTFGSGDERLNRWVVSFRSPRLTDLSQLGSQVGDIPVLPAVVLAVCLGCLLARRFRVAAFLVAAILAEAAIYRVATIAVPRARPSVVRLDTLPANASFPSGHVGASVAVFVGLALLVTARPLARAVRAAIWASAGLVVLVVAASRMYRGMHHLSDIVAGVVVGCLALLVAAGAARAAGAVAARRDAA
jgi:undecaprenyl-diphosphatase